MSILRFVLRSRNYSQRIQHTTHDMAMSAPKKSARQIFTDPALDVDQFTTFQIRCVPRAHAQPHPRQIEHLFVSSSYQNIRSNVKHPGFAVS